MLSKSVFIAQIVEGELVNAGWQIWIVCRQTNTSLQTNVGHVFDQYKLSIYQIVSIIYCNVPSHINEKIRYYYQVHCNK